MRGARKRVVRSPVQRRTGRSLAVAAAAAFLAPGLMASADEVDHGKGHVSKHVSDMILAPFRQSGASLDQKKTQGSEASPPTEPVNEAKDPDPELIHFAPFVISGDSGPKLAKDSTEMKESDGALPGTGVVEIKGRHSTIRIHRFLFVPFLFNLSW